MHILLTDHLVCPRCGPEFGLIVRADEMDGRQVVAGSLGCANCRSSYTVARGVADLRTGAEDRLELSAPPGSEEDRALRTAALLGAQPANATLLILEAAGEHVGEIAGFLAERHLVGASTSVPRAAVDADFVSRVMVGGRLPFRPRAFAGIAILGDPGPGLLDQALRALAPGGRLVLDGAGDRAAPALRDAGLEVLLEQDEVVVAATPRRR